MCRPYWHMFVCGKGAREPVSQTVATFPPSSFRQQPHRTFIDGRPTLLSFPVLDVDSDGGVLVLVGCRIWPGVAWQDDRTNERTNGNGGRIEFK